MNDSARRLPQRRRPARHRAHPQTWPYRPADVGRLLVALGCGAGAALLCAGLMFTVLPLVAP